MSASGVDVCVAGVRDEARTTNVATCTMYAVIVWFSSCALCNGSSSIVVFAERERKINGTQGRATMDDIARCVCLFTREHPCVCCILCCSSAFRSTPGLRAHARWNTISITCTPALAHSHVFSISLLSTMFLFVCS